MTEEEAGELYDQLVAYIRLRRDPSPSRGEDWLSQLEVEIAEQKEEQVVITVPGRERVSDPLHGERPTGGKSRVEFTKRRPFTAVERLDFLLEAISLNAVAPPMMSTRLLNVIEENQETSVDALFFVDDASEQPQRRIDPEEERQSAERIQELLAVIQSIRQELNPSSRRKVRRSVREVHEHGVES